MEEEKREQQRLGDLIRERRSALGLSQEALAEQMNVSRQAVAKWESGKSFPASERLLELCKVLEIPAEQLLRQEAAHAQQQKKALRPAQVMLVIFVVGLALIWGGGLVMGFICEAGFQFSWTLFNIGILWGILWLFVFVVYLIWQLCKRL